MRLEWHLLAIQDREAIYEYIAEDSPQSAVQVDEAIERQVELLALSPEIGRPGRIAGTRELVIERTPYLAAYTIGRDAVRILRILHGARKWPGAL